MPLEGAVTALAFEINSSAATAEWIGWDLIRKSRFGGYSRSELRSD
jgi:hypothetical protein